MCQLIIHHHGRDEVVTPLRNTRTSFVYRGEDGQRHVLHQGEISGVRIPEDES